MNPIGQAKRAALPLPSTSPLLPAPQKARHRAIGLDAAGAAAKKYVYPSYPSKGSTAPRQLGLANPLLSSNIMSKTRVTPLTHHARIRPQPFAPPAVSPPTRCFSSV